MANPLVGIIMGSKTDLETLQGAVDILREFGVEYEVRVLSAHRTPEAVLEWSQTAEQRGLEVLIAGAGGADALLSIVQMPRGVPVGTMAIGKPGAANAALLAIAIMAGKRPDLREKLRAWRKARAEEVEKADASVRKG